MSQQHPLVPYHSQHLLLPFNPGKNTLARINPYLEWLNLTGKDWRIPDLASYRDYLLQRLTPESAQAHLSTIKGRYRELLKNNELRDELFMMFGDDLSFAERKARVDEIVQRVENAINSKESSVSVTRHQDEEHGIRLSASEVKQLIDTIDTRTLTGRRDDALIRLMLATGIREEEAALLEVEDLYGTYEGHSALFVRRGKGNKSRFVLYGALEQWALDSVDRWFRQAAITEGCVFRKIYKGGTRISPEGLNKQSIGFIIGKYPIYRRGQLIEIAPHDLRRTYARRCHESGLTIEAIARNMGHSNIATTLRYIGDMSAETRKPGAIYE